MTFKENIYLINKYSNKIFARYACFCDAPNIAFNEDSEIIPFKGRTLVRYVLIFDLNIKKINRDLLYYRTAQIVVANMSS